MKEILLNLNVLNLNVLAEVCALRVLLVLKLMFSTLDVEVRTRRGSVATCRADRVSTSTPVPTTRCC